MISLLLAALMAGAPAAEPAAAAATPAAASPAKAEKASDKMAMVCKKEPVLGSRMKTRVCLTQQEWDERQQESRDAVDAAQRNIPLRSN